MKQIKKPTIVVVLGLLATIGCQNNTGDLTSFDQDLLGELSAAQNEVYLNDELAKVDASGMQFEDADAVFSIGWKPHYNPEENQLEIHSHAFAVAPNQDSDDNAFFRAGLDMGDVNLSCDASIIELNKIDVRDRGYFYEYGKRRGGKHGKGPRMGQGGFQQPEILEDIEEIPYLPGGVYKFETSGTDNLPAITVEATAPDNNIQIISPAAGASIDTTVELKVAWNGSITDQNLVVVLLPEIDRGDFKGGRPGGHQGGQNGMRPPKGNQGQGMRPQQGNLGQGPDPSNSFGGPKLKHPMFSEYAARYVVEQNTGEFTFSLEDIQKVLSHENVIGLRLEVMQASAIEINDGIAKYVVQFRLGDMVQLQIQ